ncbi:MAG: GWxTD domain-containing protein [Bacteroidales bacterium]|nr:GWxTD domain-containing protein [Bacteroidales bacterium]
MKYYKSFLFCALFFISLNVSALRADLNCKTFYSPTIGSYVETNLLIHASSLNYQKLSNGGFQGAVNITIMFMKGEEVANFSKIRLDSPIVENMSNIADFLDHQRFMLPDGVYEMSIIMADATLPEKEYVHKEEVTLDYAEKKVSISSIELLNSYEKADENAQTKFSKSGYNLIPKVYSFYDAKESQLAFYCEIYHTENALGANEPFLISYHLQGFESKHIMNNFSGFKRVQSSDINPLLISLNINELASGNYTLMVEARDKNNTLLVQNSIFFQRSNPNAKFDTDNLYNIAAGNMFTLKYNDIDSLREYVSWLYPQASYIEKQFIFHQTKAADVNILQRFLYSFWTERDELNPERAWEEYARLVAATNKEFRAGRTKGYQTDRGRVYLQYGPPSIIVDRSFDTGNSGFTTNIDGESNSREGGLVPYQIWRYDVLGAQRARTFVFANKNIAAQSYDLIHSDAQGEIFNPQWQTELSRNRYDPQIEQRQDRNIFEGQSGEFYRVPY